ncbi:MAG: BRO family protein [Sarcina sp.]
MAVDIAKLLNYKEPSHSISLCIEREMFIENREYSLLKGEDLKKFKGIIGDDIADNVRYSSKLMIFYESGLYGFLQYSDKLVAITFKTWIRLQVIPQIRKNKVYIL